MRGLNNKVVVVTGGGAGIGRATCLAFAKYGAKTVIAEINNHFGTEVENCIINAGGHALYIPADVSNECDIQKTVKESINRFGKIDILVNCAAAFIMRGIEATVEEWHKIMSVNIMAYALCAKHIVPEMKKVGGGSIINVCSISGFIAQPKFVTYGATKGAVANMTRCMALDLAEDNIRVNAVSPGTVWTKSNENFIKNEYGLDRKGADEHPELGGAHMIKRCADPEEIAEAILFLASDSASFITAENLMVDGGYTAK